MILRTTPRIHRFKSICMAVCLVYGMLLLHPPRADGEPLVVATTVLTMLSQLARTLQSGANPLAVTAGQTREIAEMSLEGIRQLHNRLDNMEGSLGAILDKLDDMHKIIRLEIERGFNRERIRNIRGNIRHMKEKSSALEKIMKSAETVEKKLEAAPREDKDELSKYLKKHREDIDLLTEELRGSLVDLQQKVRALEANDHHALLPAFIVAMHVELHGLAALGKHEAEVEAAREYYQEQLGSHLLLLKKADLPRKSLTYAIHRTWQEFVSPLGIRKQRWIRITASAFQNSHCLELDESRVYVRLYTVEDKDGEVSLLPNFDAIMNGTCRLRWSTWPKSITEMYAETIKDIEGLHGKLMILYSLRNLIQANYHAAVGISLEEGQKRYYGRVVTPDWYSFLQEGSAGWLENYTQILRKQAEATLLYQREKIGSSVYVSPDAEEDERTTAYRTTAYRCENKICFTPIMSISCNYLGWREWDEGRHPIFPEGPTEYQREVCGYERLPRSIEVDRDPRTLQVYYTRHSDTAYEDMVTDMSRLFPPLTTELWETERMLSSCEQASEPYDSCINAIRNGAPRSRGGPYLDKDKPIRRKVDPIR